MADPFGYLKHQRKEFARDEEIAGGNSRQVLSASHTELQAGRCIDCGTPFCEILGCPAMNRIPDWIGMVNSRKWRTALHMLHARNNFPEITGRVCPAPCESACILSISHEPVTIRQIECEIAECGWESGWIVPEPPTAPSGRRVAIIGSGPAGLAAAQQLARKGHAVTVYEREDRMGGILRYGIPDFLLDKRMLERRISQLSAEGIIFESRVDAGIDLSIGYLMRSFDAVLVIERSGMPIDPDLPGREYHGIIQAMDFLTMQNRVVAGDISTDDNPVSARGKKVMVIGDGELAAYCVETARRQGAAEITVVEIPVSSAEVSGRRFLWPMAADASETAAGVGKRSTITGMTVEKFSGDNGSLTGCRLKRVEKLPANTPNRKHVEPEADTLALPVDMAILALGFCSNDSGPQFRNLFRETEKADTPLLKKTRDSTSRRVFTASDAVMGGVPVILAIANGRNVAESIDRYFDELR